MRSGHPGSGRGQLSEDTANVQLSEAKKNKEIWTAVGIPFEQKQEPNRASNVNSEMVSRLDVGAMQEEFSFRSSLFLGGHLSSFNTVKREFNIFALRQRAPVSSEGQAGYYSLPSAARS